MNTKKKNKKFSILVDTSYLITLSDHKNRSNGSTALDYQKYFQDNGYDLLLSTIVVAEFQQGQDIGDILQLGSFRLLPYNLEDARMTAHVIQEHNRIKAAGVSGGASALQVSRAQFKDDYKIIGQAENHKIDFIITDDVSTLARYTEKLCKADSISVKVIKLAEGFNMSHFNGGQITLVPPA